MENNQTQEPQQNNENTQESTQLTKKQRRTLKKHQQREERVRVARASKAKKWFAWLGVIVVIVLGLWLLISTSNSSGSVEVPPSNEITTKDWTKGGANTQASIIEYSDFQCPACGSYFPIVKQLTEEFGDLVQFAYRHYPLRSIHPNAEKGARAAEAAGAQGKFWEMHDQLFERQNDWSSLRNPDNIFSIYAQNLEIDVKKFEQDYKSSLTKDTVKAHETAGRRIGINGTPSFILNGEQITSPQGYQEFRALLVGLVGEPNIEDEQTSSTTKDFIQENREQQNSE